MNHENLRLITTIDEAFGKDRTSGVGLESYRRFASSGGYEYSAEWGWHFYSFLGIRPNVEKEGDAGDSRRLASLYKNYTFAADMAARMSTKRCLILEHQGNVIHFFFPGKDYKIEDLRDFARRLTALVETYVLGYYEKEVIRFAMASQFGQSIIIHAPSPAGDESSVSIVSLGPCANYPAKRMVERLTDYECPWSWWSQTEWEVEECHLTENEGRSLRESYATDELYSQFDEVVAPGVQFRGSATGLNESLAVSQGVNDSASRRSAFFFRADMDGFTRKVDDAFKNNKTRELTLEFIRYMKLVEQWEIQSVFLRMIPHPWAGDCCNVEVVARDAYNSMFSSLRGSEPMGIIRDWERYVKSNKFSGFEFHMHKAIRTLVPRSPRYEKCKKLVLFPYAGTDRDYEECKQDIGDKLKDGVDGWILDEFQNQLPILGWIQAQKMTHCNAMFNACRWLVVSVIVLVVLCVIPRATVVTYENHAVTQTAVFEQCVGPHDGVRTEIRSSEDNKCFIQGAVR